MSELKTMFGTGHRPLNGAWDIAHSDRQRIRAHLVPLLERAHSAGGFNTFMFGGAQGFDQDFALSVIELRTIHKCEVYLTAAIPFKGFHEYWPKSVQEIYNQIIEQCDDIVYVCDPGYADWKYHARNQFMVDNSEEGIALWNGKPGGTKSCIKYALSKGKRVLNLLDFPIERARK